MISVIMLTYNRETLVPRAIESILSQDFSDFEFIIVNNGSTDNSGKIAEEYAKKDNRILVISRLRGNIGSGRNAGLDAAKGEYVAFIDDDDYCEKDFLSFLYNLAKDNDADISICGSFGKEFDEKIVYTAQDALVELFSRRKFNVQFPTKLIRRELFTGIRFSETAKYDDIELMPKIIEKANKIVYNGRAKYTFSRHENNNSAWTTNHSLLNDTTLDEYLGVYQRRTQELSQKFPARVPAWKYYEWSFMISMVEKINRLKISGCEKQLARMLSELRNNREEFLSSEYIENFEKKWVEKYV